MTGKATNIGLTITRFAGFGEDELDVEARENALVVSGEKAGEGEEAAYLFKGIAGRNFKRVFRIAIGSDSEGLVSKTKKLFEGTGENAA